MRSFVVSSTSELIRLRRGSDRRFYRRIEIDPSLRDGAMAGALAILVAGLNRHLNACGCGLASVVVVSLACLAWRFSFSWMHWQDWQLWATAFGVLCAAASAGKLVSLAYSEWMFRRLLGRLAETLTSDGSPT